MFAQHEMVNDPQILALTTASLVKLLIEMPVMSEFFYLDWRHKRCIIKKMQASQLGAFPQSEQLPLSTMS